MGGNAFESERRLWRFIVLNRLSVFSLLSYSMSSSDDGDTKYYSTPNRLGKIIVLASFCFVNISKATLPQQLFPS